jgi:uncharacterized protein DUF3352
MRPTLKALAPVICVLALIIVGCGGSDDESASPLDNALGFLPEDAPFVVAFDTDVEGDQYRAVGEIAERFQFGRQALDQLREQLEQEQGGISYEDDVKPLLGNPFVVGGTDARSFTQEGDTEEFVGAVEAKDGDKLKEVIEKGDAKEEGEQNGATIYEDEDGDAYAIKDDTLVVAGSRKVLDAALEQREADGRLEEDAFEEALDGLPENALMRAYFDVEGLLKADPETADARKVKWVQSLRTFGLTASAKSDSVDFQFDLKTDGADLSEEDLPIAGGDEAPEVVQRKGEINIGLRDPSQIVAFAESAGQAIDPSGFGDYGAAKEQLEQRLDVSIDDDIVGQLKGDVSVNMTVDGKYGVRAELEDPDAFRQTLEKVGDLLPRVAEGAGVPGPLGLAKPKRGQDFYALAQADGDSIVFGVVDDVFVLSNEPARAGELSTETPQAVQGAEGSVVIQADAEQLVNQALGQFSTQLGLGALGGELLTGPLADLTGSASSSTDGVRGSFSLALD